MSEENTKFELNRRTVLKAFGASAIGSLVIPSFGPASAFAQGGSKSQLVVGVSQEPTKLNPLMEPLETDRGVHYALYDALVGIDGQGKYFPVLAAEIPTVDNGGISSDGLHYKIKLRPDVKWHDGKPFTAEDVKFSIELMNNPDFPSGARVGHNLVGDITVSSPTEVSWTMREPFAPYLAILANTFVVPAHAFEGVTSYANAPFNDAPIGTGAFKFDKRVSGDRIELVKNDNYFLEPPAIDRLVFRYVSDLTVLYTQFKTGDIDLVSYQYITPDNYAEAKGLGDKAVEILGSTQIETVLLNAGMPQLQDKAVRQALYLAIDKASIVDALYYGVPKTTDSVYPQESVYFADDLEPHEFSIERANKLLDDAGWERGSDGIRAKNGLRLAFTISTTAGNHLREQTEQFMQQTYREIGVELAIGNLPPTVMWGDHFMKSQYELCLVASNYVFGGNPDVSTYFRSSNIPLEGGPGKNTFQFKNKELDALVDEGVKTFDQNEQAAIYRKVQHVLREELPVLPLFQYAFVSGRTAKLQGTKPNSNYYVDLWNVAEWRLA